MAIGDIKTFDIQYSGLQLRVIAIDSGNGTTTFEIKCLSGSADVNAIYWGDDTVDGTRFDLAGSVNMNGTKEDWDGGLKLSDSGLGKLGWNKSTALTAGEAYVVSKAVVKWDDVDVLGIRATSTSTDGGSIKGVDNSADVILVPKVSINDVTVVEGDCAQFTVSVDHAYLYDITVQYSTSDGSAKAASDYAAKSGSVVIAAGSTSAVVKIATLDNQAYEVNEQFTVNLSSASASPLGVAVQAAINDAIGEGTITDNDPAPKFSINDMTVNEAAGTITFTVTKTGLTEVTATVDFLATPGTAATPADFGGALSGSLTFAPGDTTKSITLSVVDDAIYELSEQFSVDLGNATHATIDDGHGVGTITNNDPAPQFSIDDVTVNEAAGTITFTVTKTGLTEVTATVDFLATPGTAATPADFGGALSGSLTFAPGDTTKLITLSVVDDAIYELSEQFSVDLGNATHATIDDGHGVGTITNNDPAPQFSIDDVTVNEAAGTITFTVTKTGLTEVTATVDFLATPGTAATPADFDGALGGTLTFAPGDATKSITLSVADDGIYELSEQFSVDLGNATHATIDDGHGVGIITDNDPAPTLSIDSPAAVDESAGTITFTVTLSGPADKAITVDYATVNGTAMSGPGGDYVGKSGTLTFNPGDALTKTVVVAINNDTTTESTESFTVHLGNAKYDGSAALGITTADGTGTILDNDNNSAPTAVTDNWIFSNTSNAKVDVSWLTWNDGDADGNNTYVTEVHLVGGGNGWSVNSTAYDASNPTHLLNFGVNSGNNSENAMLAYTLSDGITTSTGTVNLIWLNQSSPGNDPINLTGYSYDHAYIESQNGNDTVTGSAGSWVNWFIGGTGNDTLIGGSHNDVLEGGAGGDSLTGGAGVDRFVYRTGDSQPGLTSGQSPVVKYDTITDFLTGTDVIDFSSMNITGFQGTSGSFQALGAHQAELVVSGGDAILYANTSGNTVNGASQAAVEIHLTGVNAMSSLDFIFGT